jgi:serine/threonine protein kinase
VTNGIPLVSFTSLTGWHCKFRPNTEGPVELHNWMERCWSAIPTNRPTFSALQGVVRLLLLEDGDELRDKVAAATRLRLDTHNGSMQWTLPMRGWEPTPAGPTDCGRFQLIQYRTVAAAGSADATGGQIVAAVRLGISASGAKDIATLKTVFTVLQDLKHDHVVALLGCSMINGFVMLFDAGSLTLSVALHSGYGGVVPDLLATHASKADAALQMALGIEYLHAGRLVHGRMSSASFYFTADGTNLRLLLGNVLHADGRNKLLQPRAHHRRYPANLRWTPPELVPSPGQEQPLPAPTAAADVYGFGVILWELYADAGVPHSSGFPTDDILFDAIIATDAPIIPPLATPPLFWGTAEAEQTAMLHSIFTACVQAGKWARPWISGVASIFLDEGPDRWEKDRTQLQFVQHLGSGQFGDVSKMSTRLFSPDQSLDFVAVKMLKPSNTGAGANKINAYSGYAMSTNIATAETTDPPDQALLKEFLAEMAVMKQFRHPNLVRLLGCCTKTQPNYMILEFSTGGSLDDWLPVNGPKLLKPTNAKLVHLLHQVSLGMLALGHAGLVHRDLAARNVLVDENLQIKVADFGLSRETRTSREDRNYYRMQTNRPLPLRWIAPEGIKLGKFSVATDVYAFGVLVFEVFSFGAFPFAAYDNDMVFIGFLAGVDRRATGGVGAGSGVLVIAGDTVSSGEVGPVHEPLVAQLAAVLKTHGVREVPPLIEELLRCCVAREPAERHTFEWIAKRTSRTTTVAAGAGSVVGQAGGARGAAVAITAVTPAEGGGTEQLGAAGGEAETKV